MANNYELTAFSIEVNEEEKKWWEETVKIIEDSIDREVRIDSDAALKVLTHRSVSVIKALETDVEDLGWGLGGFDIDYRGKKEIYFCAEEYGNYGGVANLIQLFLKEVSPKRFISFEWAATCDKMRAGEFGGGIALISATEVCVLPTGYIAYQAEKAFNEGKSICLI